VIHREVKAMLGRPGESDKDLLRRFKAYVRETPKPCWELLFCPYGPLVEEYPGVPSEVRPPEGDPAELEALIAAEEAGDGVGVEPWVVDLWRGRLERLRDESGELEVIPRVFEDAMCTVFGHMCPVYFLAEGATESDEEPSRSRHIPPSVILRVARRDNYTCQSCGKQLRDHELEFDHIIPVARGGLTRESNLRLTCRACNRRKGSRVPGQGV